MFSEMTLKMVTCQSYTIVYHEQDNCNVNKDYILFYIYLFDIEKSQNAQSFSTNGMFPFDIL